MGQSEGLDRLLKEHPFFVGMEPQVCETLVECATSEQFRAGEYIFREGSPATWFYLIHYGSVVLEIHVPGREPIVIDTLEDGEVLGLSWLVAPYQWAYDAHVIRLTQLISLDAACVRRKYDSDPTLACELFKRYIPLLADRLAATRRKVIEKARATRRREVKRYGPGRGT